MCCSRNRNVIVLVKWGGGGVGGWGGGGVEGWGCSGASYKLGDCKVQVEKVNDFVVVNFCNHPRFNLIEF
jgi:hypothetical protein